VELEIGDMILIKLQLIDKTL